MVAKPKGKSMPKDYQLNLFIQLRNLKQRGMLVKEYIKEFCKLNIRVGHVEEDAKNISIYINGLRFDIQYEINILSPKSVEEAYQYYLKAEEKLSRKQNLRGSGRSNRGRGK